MLHAIQPDRQPLKINIDGFCTLFTRDSQSVTRPYGFKLFPRLKAQLRGIHFQTSEELKIVTQNIVSRSNNSGMWKAIRNACC